MEDVSSAITAKNHMIVGNVLRITNILKKILLRQKHVKIGKKVNVN